VQRLVDADLVGAERAAALQHEDDLARQRRLPDLRACAALPARGAAASPWPSSFAASVLRPAAVHRDRARRHRRGRSEARKTAERGELVDADEVLARLVDEEDVADDVGL
jgi:hypothetical protein